MTPFHVRRAYFDNYLENVTVSPGRYGYRFTCPCCGYPTLGGRAEYEICFLCNWEDDGQDDSNAGDNPGGPNRGFTLEQARLNFEQRLVMYGPGHDSRIGGSDTPAEIGAKQRGIAAFEELIDAAESKHSTLWNAVRAAHRELHLLLKRRIRAFEGGG